MKKLFYTTPEVEIVEIAVESGFSVSINGNDVDSMDYRFGGDGVEMD